MITEFDCQISLGTDLSDLGLDFFQHNDIIVLKGILVSEPNEMVEWMIPPFEPDGTLPPGIYWASWEEVVEHFGFNAHRRALLEGLAQAIDVLRIAGCPTIYLDGSFVTAKPLPNDFDACWIRDGVNVDMLDPELLDCTPRGRATQKIRYGGEFFPIRRYQERMRKSLLAFFQIDRETGLAKGIIALDLRALP